MSLKYSALRVIYYLPLRQCKYVREDFVFGFDAPNADFVTLPGVLGAFVIYIYLFIMKVLLYQKY